MDNKLPNWLKILLIAFLSISVLLLLMSIGFYVYKFRLSDLADKPDAWGQFGDYFGGTLNPILSIISIDTDEDNR